MGGGVWNDVDGTGDATRVRLERGVPAIVEMGATAEADDGEDILSTLVSKDLSKPYADV
jgi:hypothetical protein